MATLEYRFTKSSPVLRDLARTRHQSPSSPLFTNSSEYTERIKPFEYIDNSLTLLGDIQRVQDHHLRREFEQQREFITGKFEREQYENGRRDQVVEQRFGRIKEQLDNFKEEVDQRFEEVGQRFEEVGQRFEEVGQRFEEVGQRFEEVGQRFEEVGQRFDKVETKLDDFRQEFEQRFSEMNARMFNTLAYRVLDVIHPVPILRGDHLVIPEDEYFPRNVKKFWALQLRRNARKRFYLIQFYSLEYKRWNRESESLESDSNDSSEESLTLDDAARYHPWKFLQALAARLGLHYRKIYAGMMRLQESQQQTTNRPSKRPQADVDSSEGSEISKRVHGSPARSTTSESQPEQPPSRRSLLVRNSQGPTDVVSETDLQGTEQRSHGSTEVFSFETTQPTSGER